MDHPINVGIKYPARIAVEYSPDYSAMEDNVTLSFYGSDGSRLTVILSLEQANALAGAGSTDPAGMARDLYVRGHIGVDELERRLDLAARGRSVV